MPHITDRGAVSSRGPASTAANQSTATSRSEAWQRWPRAMATARPRYRYLSGIVCWENSATSWNQAGSVTGSRCSAASAQPFRDGWILDAPHPAANAAKRRRKTMTREIEVETERATHIRQVNMENLSYRNRRSQEPSEPV